MVESEQYSNGVSGGYLVLLVQFFDLCGVVVGQRSWHPASSSPRAAQTADALSRNLRPLAPRKTVAAAKELKRIDEHAKVKETVYMQARRACACR
jgi:hypothetical protein